MKYLFLDTNIFIHYKGYEDIPWKSLLNTEDDISVVLTSIVLREIDGHKDNSKGRVRNKARKMSEKFNKILLNNQQSRVPLLYCRETPIDDDEKKTFDLTVNDDRFLLNVLHSLYQKADVYVVSNDTDLLLKAKELGLNILSLDDTYRSAEEPPAEEKELKKVKDELARWTNRCSDPKILFCDTNSDCLEFEQFCYEPIDAIVEQKVHEEAAKYPEDGEAPITYDNFMGTSPSIVMYTKLLLQRTPEERACFNHMRKKYLEDYKKKEILMAKQNLYGRSFKQLKLKVVNDGTAQTGDLHVVLKFPKGVRLYTPSESISKYEYKQPIKPQYNKNFVVPNLRDLSLFSGYPEYCVKMWNPDKPSVKTEFVSRLKKLTHGLKIELKDEIYINTEVSHDFEIGWYIADSSLVDHKKGKLRVIVSDKTKK